MKDKTLDYILSHKRRVIQWMGVFIQELERRAETHDNSKLEKPEIDGWHKMDNEPLYSYGTKEYYDKVTRYHWLMELHWKRNRHHPEYWQMRPDRKDRDLIDYIEMLVDWLAYSDKKLSYVEARKLVAKQAARYHMDKLNDPVNNPPMSELLLNTITNYFVEFVPDSLQNSDCSTLKKLAEDEEYMKKYQKGLLLDMKV